MAILSKHEGSRLTNLPLFVLLAVGVCIATGVGSILPTLVVLPAFLVPLVLNGHVSTGFQVVCALRRFFDLLGAVALFNYDVSWSASVATALITVYVWQLVRYSRVKRADWTLLL